MAKRKGKAAAARASDTKRPLWVRLLKWSVVLLVVGALVGVLTVAGVLFYYGRDLPSIENLGDYDPPQVTRVMSAEGDLLALWTDERRLIRTVLNEDEIPQVMRDAMIAAEDSRFYEHPGLDYRGLIRAVVTNLRRGELSQGASTITQQVVKNLVLSPERSIRRKVQEAILAYRIDQNLDKDDILTIYLNEIFFGVAYYGIEEASQYYFGHSARTLNLQEAALLAGLVQSPNRYNPRRHPERALSRRQYVLRQMWNNAMISEAQYRAAVESPLGLDETRSDRAYLNAFPYFVDAVRRELAEHVDEEELATGGLQITTTLIPRVQRAAEDALQQGLRDFDARHGFHTPYRTLESEEEIAAWRRDYANGVEERGLLTDEVYRAVILETDDEATTMAIGPYVVSLLREPESRLRPDERTWQELFPPGRVFSVAPVRNIPVSELSADDVGRNVVRLLPPAQGAIVALDPASREVRAVVGGYDFASNPFNRALQARRQVGSSFKPFIYAAALDARLRELNAATIVQDTVVTYPLNGSRDWQPANYDGRYLGPMSVREALARSRNVVSVRLLDLVGMQRATAFIERAGIDADLPDNLTLALGSAELTPIEMVSAFATFADGGRVGEAIFVREVRDSHGDVRWQPEGVLREGIGEATAWLTTSLMRSVVTEGTGGRARALDFEVVGKTGTTNDVRDAWFVGYSPALVAGVWVGYDNNDSLGRGESGGSTALPIWVNFMREAHEGLDTPGFGPPPEGIVERRVDPESGLLARDGQPSRVEYFLAGTEPTRYAQSASESSIRDTILGGGNPTPQPEVQQDGSAPGEIDGGF